MITLKTNWDEVLNNILKESQTCVEPKEVVKDSRIKSESFLLKPVKLTDISPKWFRRFLIGGRA